MKRSPGCPAERGRELQGRAVGRGGGMELRLKDNFFFRAELDYKQATVYCWF